MPKTKIPELLAPAGDWVSLDAALGAGADAVYFGVEGLNMRAGARNFRRRDLRKVVERCHARRVRAYLTLNVVVFEKELPVVKRLLAMARAAGVDAVIGADFAVLQAARAAGLPVHASTQMSAANSAAIGLLHALGVNRFVLARECSLEDIARIRKSLKGASAKVEIEVFAHGAMCVSMSGRCFLSQFESGRSANRGECTQPCRRKYRIIEERGDSSWEVGEDYLLSPSDLCTLLFLEKLIRAGVGALKIEGRNRGPEYVASVVGAYREALDFYAARHGSRGFVSAWESKKAELQARVARVYNRTFSSGFYLGRPLGKWSLPPHNAAPEKKCFVGTVVNFYRRPSVAEIAVQDTPFTQGETLTIEGATTGFLRETATSLQVEAQAVTEAPRGARVGLKVSGVVRRGDKVYVMRPR